MANPIVNSELQSLRQLRGLIIDMDGVLWYGDKPLPGLNRFFNIIRKREIKFILATNNNTQTPEGFKSKAAAMGVEVDVSEVLNASVATVHFLKSHFPPGSRMYVVGEAPLKGLISEAGFILANQDVSAVVATMDRALTYDMLKRATILIRAGAEFIGPNPDASYPTPEGIAPGGGAILAAIAIAADRQPLIIGKPERRMFDIALERMGLQANEVASLGDRLDTDIAGGQRAGMKTILVLSGIAKLEDCATSPIKPTWIFQGIDDLASALAIE